MRITEISFCDKVGYNIRSDETKKYILETIESKYKIKIVAKHFEKFDGERSVKILNNNPHLACVRSNGNPYLLLFTRHNFNDIAIFIDKKVQQGYFLPRMIIAHIMIGRDRSFHDDTIFEGEMVKTNDGGWLYLINDMLVYRGQHLHNVNLVKRINIVYDILQKDYEPNDMSPFQIAVKKYFTYDEVKTGLDDHIAVLPYTCRGMYFKPLFLKFRDILVNFDDSLVKKVKREKYGSEFKLGIITDGIITDGIIADGIITDGIIADRKKNEDMPAAATPSLKSTKQFPTRKTAAPDVYELLDASGKVLGNACVNTMKLSTKMRQMFEEKNLVDKININYEFSAKFNKWLPQLS